MADDSQDPGEIRMFASALIAISVAGAPTQMVQCVDVPAGWTAARVEARGKAWFVDGEAITLGGRRYVRHGRPRGLSPAGLSPLQAYKGAMVYAEAGGSGRGMIYLLADIRDCTFQPYRAQP